MALYVATDTLMPTSDWSPGSIIVVQEIGTSEKTVELQFTKPHVRYVGAYGGCACGFSYDPADPSADLVLQSLAELRNLIGRHLSDVDHAELFYCWEGDEGRVPDYRTDTVLDELGSDACRLKTTAFYRVRRRRPTRSIWTPPVK
jgi:hypothetical protein